MKVTLNAIVITWRDNRDILMAIKRGDYTKKKTPEEMRTYNETWKMKEETKQKHGKEQIDKTRKQDERKPGKRR